MEVMRGNRERRENEGTFKGADSSKTRQKCCTRICKEEEGLSATVGVYISWE